MGSEFSSRHEGMNAASPSSSFPGCIGLRFCVRCRMVTGMDINKIIVISLVLVLVLATVGPSPSHSGTSGVAASARVSTRTH